MRTLITAVLASAALILIDSWIAKQLMNCPYIPVHMLIGFLLLSVLVYLEGRRRQNKRPRSVLFEMPLILGVMGVLKYVTTPDPAQNVIIVYAFGLAIVLGFMSFLNAYRRKIEKADLTEADRNELMGGIAKF